MQLTPYLNIYSMDSPLQHEAVGIGLLNVAAKPLIRGFFIPITQHSFMVGWVEQLSSWPVATSVDQLRSVCLPMIGLIRRQVFNLSSGVAIMSNHPPKSKNTNTLIHYVSLNSLFFLLDSNKNRLTSDLTFNQARDISEHIPGSIVKFQKMEANKCIQRINNKNDICSFDVPKLTVESKAPSMAEMMVNLPEFLGTAISYILQDFNYEHNKKSNTAIAIRILATMADRMEIVLRRMP